MKLTLDTEYDIVNYLNFLHERSILTSKFPAIILEGKEAAMYMEWLYTEEPDDDDDSTSDDSEEVIITTHNVNKRWSSEEESALSSLILEGLHPSDIAKALKRTEDGVRKHARRTFSMSYRNGKWRDDNYSN